MSRKTAKEFLAETKCPRCSSADLKGVGDTVTMMGFRGDETRNPNHFTAARQCRGCGLSFVHRVQPASQRSRYLVNGREFHLPPTDEELDRWERGALPGQDPGDDWTGIVCELIDEVRRLRRGAKP